mmetsp:Transcript_15013/g.45436  ORF Transcript_15013/g.45436 Transcript_15013/m.45436 type:complete len:155 (+) Transcript_15013:51-515(+)|eukprot:CAMPEP_0198662618 /NCGR_PEP_ID=MMETSP1467-20131203/48326_1 /TAXON_ID=1462469 /ORGANISM="unid. sp., Strain CCMP2135" /LENGTH=154 /DNA_ID=CAMNT_0044399117 /DNA_START=49 /DNA_END=513 /DNA_ORIENTATION=+
MALADKKIVKPPLLYWPLCVAMKVAISSRYVRSWESFPTSLRYVGAGLFAAGVAVVVSVVWKFRALKTEINTYKKPLKLTTTGFFKYSRNPIYLAKTVSLAGLSLALGTPQSLVAAAFFWAACNYHYIPFEEKILLKEFGTKYEHYKATTRRWL